MDARLQLIEAVASRDASQAETELALKRLGTVRDNRPLALDSVRDNQVALEEIEQELRQLPDPPEQAEADALWAEIEAVREHDRWPRHLYWSV